MPMQRRSLYASSNGDSWSLCRDASGKVVVLHEPNASSGGKPSEIDLGTFLAKANQGPEHQALRRLIGELTDDEPAQAANDSA